MAVFDVFKQWVEKATGQIQSNDKNVLDEQFQDQAGVETPREELFKQNIFMGDTARSEITGEEQTSESIATANNEKLIARDVEQEQSGFPEQNLNEVNIPDFLKPDNDVDLNSADIKQPFSNSITTPVNPNRGVLDSTTTLTNSVSPS
ncbi:MAG: hypothetical protein ACRBDX_11835, partial [Gammaproteobacteria bacterium]